MRMFSWLIFGCLLVWIALTWNGDEVEGIGLKVCWFLRDLFMK